MSSVVDMAYECFDSTISTKPVGLVKRGRLVVSIPQPDSLFSADPSCQHAPNPKPARDVCLVAVFPHPCSCPACLRVGGVVLQQDGRSQDWLDAFHAVSNVAPVRDHTCDSASDSCDGDWICSVIKCLTFAAANAPVVSRLQPGALGGAPLSVFVRL